MRLFNAAALVGFLMLNLFCDQSDSSSADDKVDFTTSQSFTGILFSSFTNASYASNYPRSTAAGTHLDRAITIIVLCVPCTGAKIFEGKFRPKDSIHCIKKWLRSKPGLGNNSMYKLLFKNKEIDDGKTIQEAGIYEGSKLDILMIREMQEELRHIQGNSSDVLVQTQTVSSSWGLNNGATIYKTGVLANINLTTSREGVAVPPVTTGIFRPPNSILLVSVKTTSEVTPRPTTEVSQNTFLSGDTTAIVKKLPGVQPRANSTKSMNSDTKVCNSYSPERTDIGHRTHTTLIDLHGDTPRSSITRIITISSIAVTMSTISSPSPPPLALDFSKAILSTDSAEIQTGKAPESAVIASGPTQTPAQQKDIMITFNGTSFLWTGVFSPSDRILFLKQVLESGTGIMWRYLTLVHEGGILIDDQATLRNIGLDNGDNVEMGVIFATSTVTRTVWITATSKSMLTDSPVARPLLLHVSQLVSAEPTPSLSLKGKTSSLVDPGNFQSSMRLPIAGKE